MSVLAVIVTFDIELTLLPVSKPALFPVISIRCRLVHRPHSLSSFGQLGHQETMFWGRNNSTISNPFTDGLLLSREISKVSFGLPEGFSITAEK